MPTEQALVALLVVCAVAALAPLVCSVIPGRPPQVLVLLIGGVVVGPFVLHLASAAPIQLLSDLGLGFLFLLAGFEIEPAVLRSRTGRRAGVSWVLSLVLAVAAVLVMQHLGFIRAPIPIAIGLTTTALGTLLPILKDRGMLHGRLGSSVVACGALGELLPVIGIALVLGAYESWLEVLAILGVSALAWVLMALGRRAHGSPIERLILSTAHGTAQTTLRWTMVILVGLLILTAEFGIDSVLGAFLAGLVLRRWSGPELETTFNHKLDAVGYGLFIPVFFVCSGMDLDVASIIDQPLRLVVFFLLILLIRGAPVLVVFRGLLPMRERVQLGLLTSTTLPLLVALTEIGVRSGHMLPANAAALVGGGILSVALCPLLALRLARPATPARTTDAAPT